MSCSRTQRSDAREARTRGLSVSSQVLYHWATALPVSVNVWLLYDLYKFQPKQLLFGSDEPCKCTVSPETSPLALTWSIWSKYKCNKISSTCSDILCIKELCLTLNVPVNIFSVMSGLLFVCWTSTKQRIKCLAQGRNQVPPVRLEPLTPWPWVKHYHRTTALLSYKSNDCMVDTLLTPHPSMTLAHHPDMTPAPHLFMYDPNSPTRYDPGLEVIKLEYSLKLIIKHNDWLLSNTCPQAANHYSLFWVWEWTQVL